MLAESSTHSGFEDYHGLVVAAGVAERVDFCKNRRNHCFGRLCARRADNIDDARFAELFAGFVSRFGDSIGKQQEQVALALPGNLSTQQLVHITQAQRRSRRIESLRGTALGQPKLVPKYRVRKP